MADKKDIDPKVYQSAIKYKSVLIKAGIKISALYIFGSQANGTAKKWSDIDVGVVSPDFTGSRIDEGVKLMDYANKVNDFIEPHPFLPKDFEDKYYILAREVKRTGVKI